MKSLIYNVISWVLVILSIGLIVFSIFAPRLITEYYSGWDFSNKGVIGDTLGGIMNPFIAISGVCSTFLAFLMQVKANQIQREQFLKSLSKSTIDEKIDAYYKLELVNIDIKDIIVDITNRFKYLDEYIDDVKKNPLATNRLQRTVNLSYERFLSEDRTLIYKGFKLFLSKNEKWVEIYGKLYHAIEYLPELYKNVYRIADVMNQTTYEKKILLHDDLIKFESSCIDFLNNELFIKTKAHSVLESYLKQYRKVIRENFADEYKKENDLIEILEILSNCKYGLERQDAYFPAIKPLIEMCSIMVIKLNDLKRENESTLKEFDFAYESKDMVLLKLREIYPFIENGIKDISVKELQKEYLK